MNSWKMKIFPSFNQKILSPDFVEAITKCGPGFKPQEQANMMFVLGSLAEDTGGDLDPKKRRNRGAILLMKMIAKLPLQMDEMKPKELVMIACACAKVLIDAVFPPHTCQLHLIGVAH